VFSESRLKELGDEYSENYPQIQLVLARFYGLGRKYTVNGVASFIKKLLEDKQIKDACSKWIYSYSPPDRFIELLYGIGFFGVSMGNIVQFRTPGNQNTTPPSTSHSTVVDIHPCYVHALALQDKLINTISESHVLTDHGILEDLPESMDLSTYITKLNDLEDNIKSLPHGPHPHSKSFEDIVGETIKLCFYSPLTNVQEKSRTHNNTAIRDWVQAIS
jgi:hypothetical protein